MAGEVQAAALVDTAVLAPLDWIDERTARGSRHEVVPLPQRPARHQLGADARLGGAHRVHRPGADRRDPRDVLRAVVGDRPGDGQADRLLVDRDDHERAHARLARARHAPLGRERLHHPALPAHGPGLPVRRLQVPARAELDHRRADPRHGDAHGLHRLPAPVGPDGVLGDGRRDQPERHGAVRRAVARPVPRGRARRSAPTRSRSSTRCTCS